jgi:UDP-N-acetylglucosamine diphosphorylase/glucosamine-1-phosphate N-acetyltransferase
LTAIVLAAGKGVRMKSELPKVLHEVCGRPMLAYVIDACRAAGCGRLLVVVGHSCEMVRRAFAGGDADLVWIEQSEQLGTGHAVMACAEQLQRLSGPVLVVAGDGPLIRPETLERLVARHVENGADCTLATSVLDEPGRYGRVIRSAAGELEGIVEFLDADERQRMIKEVNVSLYCFDADALRAVLDELDNNNAKGEYYLTDTIGLLKARGAKLTAVAAVPPEDVMSVNTREELEQVNRIMADRLQNSGVKDDR